MDTLDTAFSSHNACFICREQNVSLHRVKKQDIIHAYAKHRIYIKTGTRCCNAHIGDNSLIRKEEFFIIETRKLPQSQEIVKMFDILCRDYDNVFEPFGEMKYLEDSHCFKTTGWTKEEFVRFSAYITSFKKTGRRTKDQLIALYRYWLRTGIDQKSLASLFGKGTCQATVSKYLDQIRAAINRDFVVHCLGAHNGRDFFLKFNSPMTHLLHDLEKDDLVIVADGTYTKIEKSVNNEFQFRTYSMQKKASLFKPFIVCCADGYIIDCYGPFSANDSDSTIFNHIIETDEDLQKILVPNKTLILIDRGFRDSLEVLKRKNLNPKIPTCSQLEEIKEKQLTTQQTGESRLVTKCRFIIEKKIGEVKKFQALDNRRNSELGHLLIDYRIACAMINFVHKPCYADGDRAELIGQRLKIKCNEDKKNILLHLMDLKLGTEVLPSTNISEINDFPKLSKKIMVEEVFFGNYYIKKCKSYLADVLRSGTCSIINQRALKSIKKPEVSVLSKEIEEDSVIIGMEIGSRYRRSLKTNVKQCDKSPIDKQNSKDSGAKKRPGHNYKVFIQYKPNVDSPESILSYVCNCKSGLKQAGCCVHVASFIYYFSYAKTREHELQIPADYLNSFLVDMAKKECPNRPLKLRKPRLKRRRSLSSEEEKVLEEPDS